MNTLQKLESRFAEAYKGLPHLHNDVRRWIATNIWWIVLVIALFDALVVISAFQHVLTFSGTHSYSKTYTASTISFGQLVLTDAVAAILKAISVVLLFMAIKPLQNMQKRGWTLLFINLLVAIIAAVLDFLLLIQNFDLLGLLWTLVYIAVELYVLYEIRGDFSGRKAVAREAEVVTAAPVAKKPTPKKKSSTAKKKSSKK